MSEEKVTQKEKLIKKAQKAHLNGWLAQSIAAGETPEEAEKSFIKNNERADNYMAKLAKIRETILEQANTLK